MPAAKNLVVIMSDEHNPKVAGYAGHPVFATPHLDRSAAAGTRFTSAYTPSPICVPARASFITGQPVHRHHAWDNAIAYGGVPPGWSHMLRAGPLREGDNVRGKRRDSMLLAGGVLAGASCRTPMTLYDVCATMRQVGASRDPE